MIDINTVIKLKKSVKKLEQEKDRAKGRAEHSLKMLKEEFDCSSLKQAKELLKKKKAVLKKLEVKYTKEEEAFLEKWGDKLRLEDDE